MIIKNKKTDQKFPCTQEEYENIVAKGLSGKYEIVEDSKPVELKRLSVEVHKKKNQSK